MIKYLRIFSLLVVLNNLSLVKPDSQWKKDANAIGFRGYDIKSFYISYFGDKYEPNQDFTGMVFYDLGSCTRSVAGICGKMRPGYIVIYKDDELTEKRDDNSLNSLGGAILKGLFRRKPADWLIKLVTEYDVKMATFSIKSGVLSTKLCTKVLKDEVEESEDMNAYEYALLDALNHMYQEKGIKKAHYVKNLQTVMEQRSPEMLETLQGLDQADEFKDEYAPDASWPKSEDDSYYPLKAVAHIGVDDYLEEGEEKCHGTVEFTQTSADSTTVKYKFNNCQPVTEDPYKFNVHEFGDGSNGCGAAGDLYVAAGVVNIKGNNKKEGTFTSADIKLDGDTSVIGRGLILSFTDDFHGAQKACGRIENYYPLKAIARLAADGFQEDKENCHGTVEFTQHSAHQTTMKYEFENCPAGSAHSIHIHEYGDVHDVCGCVAGGEIYNPFNAKSGANNYVGNIGEVTDGKGDFSSAYVHLEGEYSVIGKSVVMPFSKDEQTCGET